jgi:hypothetical protein
MSIAEEYGIQSKSIMPNECGAGKGGFAVLWPAGSAWPPCLAANVLPVRVSLPES